MKLNENFGIKIKKFKKKDGTEGQKAVLIATGNDNTFNVKDIAKSNGAYWDKFDKAWFWWDANDERIQKCLKEIETKGYIIDQIDQAIEAISDPAVKPEIKTQVTDKTEFEKLDPQTLKEKLNQFKNELVNGMSQSQFIDLMMKIKTLQRQKGYAYSLMNNILILMQDPKATMAKARGKWANTYHRVVDVENAIPCIIAVPQGKFSVTSDEKNRIRSNVLNDFDKKDEKDLTSGEKDILQVAKNPVRTLTGFKYVVVYDIRFTKPMDGYDDEYPGAKLQDLDDEAPWYEKDTTEDQKIVMLYNACITMIKDIGLTVDYETEEQLQGARGYTTGNKVVILDGEQAKGLGMCSTLIHETAHALMHFKHLAKKVPELEKYFIRNNDDNRQDLEQQAETVAFIVLRSFGYDTRETVQNYIGSWGATSSNISTVINRVSTVADFIYQTLAEIINTKRVSGTEKLHENTEGIMTDIDINSYKNLNGKITPELVAGLMGVEANATDEVFEAEEIFEDDPSVVSESEPTDEQKADVASKFKQIQQSRPFMIPCFEFDGYTDEQGDPLDEMYYQFNQDTGKLDVGTCSNAGFIPLKSFDWDYDMSIDSNLQNIYEDVLEWVLNGCKSE